jgi:NADH-quinone oxidoreductase subunit G
VGGNPTEEHPLLAWLLRTNVRLNRARLYIANSKPIKLDRQAKATQQLLADGPKNLAAFLDQGTSDFSKSLQAEESLVVLFGEEFRGEDVENLVAWGLKRGNVKFACIGDHSNSRGAADMGLFPDLLPGYVPVTAPGAFAEYPNLPVAPGKTLPQMLEAAAQSELSALLVVGADPVSRANLDPAALKNTFVVVQDLFLTETAALADVVLPAASLYEKSGTVTNTYGDVQMVRKAADRAGVKPDFEILVRLAGAMGIDVGTLVPFGKRGTTGDLGQSRGAQAGEADRHAVWLEANNLEPKLSPFDPLALLDEIERLVPGYTLDRINLFAGNDVHTELEPSPGFVPVQALTSPSLIVPAHDTLFTSGTLGQYSTALKQLTQHQAKELAETAAD